MPEQKLKVLIIKVGYSETLDPEVSNITSYGDVLRTTVLLNLYKGDNVTWLVDERAYPILQDNPFIDRILAHNSASVLQLLSEQFDTVINMEKVPGLCALADQIVARQRYGFRFDKKGDKAGAYEGTEKALSLCQDAEKKKNHNRYWQEHLFEMADAKWQGEEYVFGYRPKSEGIHDIGFNYVVGNKWPTKAWPMESWKELGRSLNGRYSVSWQRGLDNMYEYFDWINSCRLVVTNDSFGLHLAIAMKKQVVAIFGPTNPNETYLYERGITMNGQCLHMPCYSAVCRNDSNQCVSEISPEEVCSRIYTLFGEYRRRQRVDVREFVNG